MRATAPSAGEEVVILVSAEHHTLDSVTPWMPDHGHGISEERVLTDVDGGTEAAFTYSMPGWWEVEFVLDHHGESELVTIGWTVE